MPANVPIPLSRATLAHLPPTIARPTYDVGGVTAGIVHLGPGVFHRAHMARYTHDLMTIDPAAATWGIVGAGLLPADRRLVDALGPQDGLYTLTERENSSEVATVIGSVRELIDASGSTARLLSRIADPAIRIVSLTVSESGYCLDGATKRLDPGHPMIVHDRTGATPVSAIGVLVEAFRRRREAGLGGFTALSCDNIQHNGAVLRAAVLALAELREPALAGWIDARASFPSTMVDRITPRTTSADVAMIANRHGVADRWPVASELFRQWVIEDRFVAGRPDWEAVGAQFVTDVAPYETMKLRLLNASHLAIAALGQLAGFVYVDEAMRDDIFRAYMIALMDRETGSTLPVVTGVDLGAYKAQLVTRFANPVIGDTLQRIITDAPLNLLLDPIRDLLSIGAPCKLLSLALAAWLRRLADSDERAMAISPPLAEALHAVPRGGNDPLPLLAVQSVFGGLGDHATFVADVARHLGALDQHGARGALHRALA